jgi:FtsZ-binding cell division protein ZapB
MSALRRQTFFGGAMTKTKDSVLQDLYACFLSNKAVPKELSDAFVERYLRGHKGEVRSWDEVFGKPTRFGKGENIKRQIEQGYLVADEVDRLKAQGKSLNEEEFEAIGSRTAVGGKSKVKSLLHEHRFWSNRVNTLIQLGQEMFKNYRR